MGIILIIWGVIETLIGIGDVLTTSSGVTSLNVGTALAELNAFATLGNGLLFIAAGSALESVRRIVIATEHTARLLEDQFHPREEPMPRQRSR